MKYGCDLIKNSVKSHEDEDIIVNNINFKILTNELLADYKSLNTKSLIKDLGELYRNNLNDGLKFLKELCSLFNNKNSSLMMTMCNNNDLRFDFIKKLMFNLYSNDFEDNWSKFISIIDENLLL